MFSGPPIIFSSAHALPRLVGPLHSTLRLAWAPGRATIPLSGSPNRPRPSGQAVDTTPPGVASPLRRLREQPPDCRLPQMGHPMVENWPGRTDFGTRRKRSALTRSQAAPALRRLDLRPEAALLPLLLGRDNRISLQCAISSLTMPGENSAAVPWNVHDADSNPVAMRFVCAGDSRVPMIGALVR